MTFRNLFKLAGAVLLGLPAAQCAVVYTFSGTTGSPPGTPPRSETCRYISPGFINSIVSVGQAELTSCVNCAYGITFGPMTQNGVLGDSFDFGDVNNTMYIYQFPLGSFQTVGTHTTVANWENVGTLTVEVTPGLAVVNAASFGGTSIAADEIVTVFSSERLTEETLSAASPLPNSLGGVTVTVRDGLGVDRPGQLLFLSPYQLNIVLPGGLAPGPGMVSVTNSTGFRQSLPVTVSRLAPGIFSMNADGRGVPAAQIVRVQSDGSQVLEDVASWNAANDTWEPQPIRMGQDTLYLVLYGTGLRDSSGTNSPFLLISGLRGETRSDYAGPQSQYPGLDQVNTRLPAELKGAGSVRVIFSVDGQWSNTMTLLFRE
jgi:uncharacterized protein (TIGR03437 family)